jgi:hypothetical protein
MLPWISDRNKLVCRVGEALIREVFTEEEKTNARVFYSA